MGRPCGLALSLFLLTERTPAVKLVKVADDGTTTVELTDSDAHALRDTLAVAAKTGDDSAWTLSRLLAHAHGEKG